MKILSMTVCCADIYPDLNLTLPGGNSLNFAVRCAMKGTDHVAVLGAVGNDLHGKLIRNHLARYGIDTRRLYTREGPTASNKIYIDSTGERCFHPDSWNGGVYQEFRLSAEDWEYASCFDIVAMPAVDPNFPEAVKRLSKGPKLVADFLDSRDFARMEEVLPHVSVLFLSGNIGTTIMLKELSRHFSSLIVVTLGKAGSIALMNGQEYFQPAMPVERVVDTTGCGDAFQAAFTMEWFNNRDVSSALKEGAIAASEVITHFGGTK